jgi:hypothetical protein
MMDDLARLYRSIEDAEFKAAILEVLIDLGSSIARAWDTQLSLTVVSTPAQTKFERKGKTMKAEKDDGYKCPRCDDHIPEQFYCRNCGYVPDWRQIETYKTPQGSGITHGAEMSYLNSTAMTFGSLPTRGIVRGRVEIIEHKARDVKSGETVIDRGTRFTIKGVKCGSRFITSRIWNA